MTTLQTGTKVLIEAEIVAIDRVNNEAQIKFNTAKAQRYAIWLPFSIITVCETAETIDKDNWKVEADDPNYHEVGKALFDKHDNWKDFDVTASGSIGKVGGYSKYNIVSPVPTITGQQALKLLGVSEPISLDNFCIDITDPVNAELLPGFKEWLKDKFSFSSDTVAKRFFDNQWKYYGCDSGVYTLTEKLFDDMNLTTLPELQKQHPGVVFNPNDFILNDFLREDNNDSLVTNGDFSGSENDWTAGNGWAHTPSFKAGQEVPKHGDKIMVGKSTGTYCCPDPVLENYHVVIMDHGSAFLSLVLGAIRPIPAQPTVESELTIPIIHIIDQARCTVISMDEAVKKILALFPEHQKHSGRVEVSVPSDEEIEKDGKERGLRDNELQLWWEGAVWMRNFMTRKEQQGNE